MPEWLRKGRKVAADGPFLSRARGSINLEKAIWILPPLARARE